MTYPVIIKPAAKEMLKQLSDQRIRAKIGDAIDKLAFAPELLGKKLGDEFTGYRSIRAAGQRYRVIYRITQEHVFVVAVGIRKEGSKRDVYRLAKKLISQGLL